LKKDRIKKFKLSEEPVKAFELLKTGMATAPVLVTPDFKKPFTIHLPLKWGEFYSKPMTRAENIPLPICQPNSTKHSGITA